jgi:DnaJ-class molecular chaperone
LDHPEPDHYAVLGLDRHCTPAQIRAAYRLLARRHHPDLNPGSPEALIRSQEINVAHETLSDPARRRAYDRDRDAARRPAASGRPVKLERNIAQDVHLRIEELLRGATIEVRVKDPTHPDEPENYRLEIPPETAPGSRFTIPRAAPFAGGSVVVRVKALPGFRWKIRGYDLRGDLRIHAKRATEGGTEVLSGPTGAPIRVQIPARIARGEVLRIPGEGLPKPRGGRGDLLVRITYRPEVRVTRLPR